MPRLNDSVNTPVNRQWKRLLIETAGKCPSQPSHTKLMRLLCQWALPQLIDRIEDGRPVADMLMPDDGLVGKAGEDSVMGIGRKVAAGPTEGASA